MFSLNGFSRMSIDSLLVSLNRCDCSPRISVARFLNCRRKRSSSCSRSAFSAARSSAFFCFRPAISVWDEARRAASSVSVRSRVSICTRMSASACRRACSAAVLSARRWPASRRAAASMAPSAAERAPSTMIARMNAVFILTKVEFSVEFFVSLTDKLFDSCNV